MALGALGSGGRTKRNGARLRGRTLGRHQRKGQFGKLGRHQRKGQFGRLGRHMRKGAFGDDDRDDDRRYGDSRHLGRKIRRLGRGGGAGGGKGHRAADFSGVKSKAKAKSKSKSAKKTKRKKGRAVKCKIVCLKAGQPRRRLCWDKHGMLVKNEPARKKKTGKTKKKAKRKTRKR